MPQGDGAAAGIDQCRVDRELPLPGERNGSSREVFCDKLSSLQNTKFELAACATEAQAGQALLDKALAEHESGGLSAADAAMVKLFCTEMQGRVLDRCLQLFGGYGYVLDYPIARAYTDARVSRIYAGSSEVMKTIVSKSMGVS
jgi:acyl-CoA dehydrogenase